METKPLVSIYVTTYNHQDFIAECLEGIVMQQTDFPFEAIVIDDCSTDDTAKIVADYTARHPDIIKPVYNSENWFRQKKSKIYPIFVSKAQGKFFAICDGDDYWTDPHKLQLQVDFLRSHPKYSACGHLCGNQHYDTSCNKHDYNVDIHDIAVEYHIQTSTLLAKMDVLRHDKELFQLVEEQQIPFSDTVVMASLLNAGSVRMMLKELSYYRQHEQSMTHKSRQTTEWKGIERIKYDAITRMYDGKFSDLGKRIHVNELMVKSAEYARDQKLFLSLQYKLRALRTMPSYLVKLYCRRYI